MQMTTVQTTPSHRMCVIGTFHQPLPATATAKPVTQAMATMTRPCASRKLRSLGTSASTRASAPANQAQLSLDAAPGFCSPWEWPLGRHGLRARHPRSCVLCVSGLRHGPAKNRPDVFYFRPAYVP